MVHFWSYGTGVFLDGNSIWGQISIQVFRMKEKSYTQVQLDKVAYTCGLDILKAHMRIHALSCKIKCVYVGKVTVGPWQLVLGN